MAKFPAKGRKVPEINRDEIREIFENGYRIIYRVGPNEIFILYVSFSYIQLAGIFMRIKIQKWVNILVLRIRNAFASQSKIREDEYGNLTRGEYKIIIEPVEEKKYSLKELISGINNTNIHYEIDFGKPVGSEHW